MKSFLANLLLVAAFGVNSETLMLEPVADTSLFEDSTQQLSNAKGPYLFVGRIQSGEGRRSLLRFDLSDIPASATISDAALTLSMNKTVSGPLNIDLLPVTRPWGEGDSNSGDPGGMGAPATMGDASWDFSAFPDTMWDDPGGDFGTLSALVSVDDVGQYTWSGPGLVADIENWIANPSSNFGWMLLGNDGSGVGTAKRFSSREDSEMVRPTLVITGMGLVPPPPPPAGAMAVPALGITGGALLCLLIVVLVWRRF